MTHLAIALREEHPARRDPDSSDRDPDGRLRARHRPAFAGRRAFEDYSAVVRAMLG